jgi:hypothetical protein
LVPVAGVPAGEILHGPDQPGRGAVARHLTDIVVARALRHGLDTGPRTDAVVRELVELARGDRRMLELALARVERGLADRSSRVGERAREVLGRALASVAAGPRLVPALAAFGPGSLIATEARWVGPNG